MKDTFLLQFCSPEEYKKTVKWLTKHHPACEHMRKRPRKAFARTLVNNAIRQVIFGEELDEITLDHCTAKRVGPDQVSLSGSDE